MLACTAMLLESLGVAHSSVIGWSVDAGLITAVAAVLLVCDRRATARRRAFVVAEAEQVLREADERVALA